MSNPQSESQQMSEFERKLLEEELSKIDKMLSSLDTDTVYVNEVENLVEDLRYQLDRREDISDDVRTVINTMLNEALEYARDVSKSVDRAETLLPSANDEELDFAKAKFMLYAIRSEILDAMQSVWPVITVYNVLCSTFDLCNEKQYDKVLDIHQRLVELEDEIVRYLINL